MNTAALLVLAGLQPGQLVTYTLPGTADTFCMRVAVLDLGTPAGPSVWLVGTGHAPQMVLHALIAAVRSGCSA